jgi:RNA polymerase sigma-70 factor (sigma-E family)
MAWMLTGDAQLAEDLLQTALARAWPHWSRIRDGQPELYVRKILIRTHASWRRRRWRGESPSAELPEIAEPDQYGASEDRLLLSRALFSLPLRQRQVVVLRYYEDMSERAVAELLGCSAGTVKSQASKGLDKLRALLGQPSLLEDER